MPDPSIFFSVVHTLSAVIWVGGMFFAYVILRPALGQLEPPQRLAVWNDVFRRFFGVVWLIVVALPLSGYARVSAGFGDLAAAGLAVDAMHIIGLIMIALFIYLNVAPYQKFRAAVAASQWPVAAGHLNSIRRIVHANMMLGLITVAIGASGRFW
ncbi:MAG: CopD family protein [Alphaproteobacteria bacterium]